MKRSGTADLPLHGGRVPPWLANRMTQLGTAITESVIVHYGRAEFLSRLSDPFWFQALGAVMGMDWHSSGITTSVLGALKRGLQPRQHELGIYVCGGRGKQSRKTPDELRKIYLHGFIVSSEGEWTVVQQGLNHATGYARRYHWHSANVKDFVHDPHTAIVGHPQGEIMNLVDHRADPAQRAMIELTHQRPEKLVSELQHMVMPRHHDVRAENVDLKRLGAVLAVAHERELHDFSELLLTENLGPRTLQSLALVAEVIHGAPSRFSDPARFSFAHGGKDGHPFPVPLKTYDETIAVLRRSLDSAKLEISEKSGGMKRLDHFVRNVEDTREPVADFDKAIAHERAISNAIGGRTVFDDVRKHKPAKRQLDLFK
jgi:uncharacterized protein